MEHPLTDYRARSGRLEPVWKVVVQTVADDVDRLLDTVMAVHPLGYGNYERTASVTARGYETAQPRQGSTTDTHIAGASRDKWACRLPTFPLTPTGVERWAR